MAKGKKGPALFEVIRAAQQKQLEQQKRLEQQKKSGPGVLTSAASRLRELNWLKPRSQSSTSANSIAPSESSHGSSMPASAELTSLESVSSSDNPPVERSLEVTRPAVVIEPKPAAASTPAEDIARQVREEIAAASRIPDTYDDPTPDPVLNRVPELFGASDPVTEAKRSVAPLLSRKLPFRMTYTTGLAAGIGLLVLASLIFVVIRINRSGDSSGSNLASLTPRPDVLEVGSASPAEQPSQAVAPGSNQARANVTTPPTGKVGIESSLQPIPLPPSGKRIVGVQYIVLLSVPREEPAQELVKFLASKGISVTAEKGLPGYSQTWYSVVTTTGFQRTRNNPEYDAFIEPINKVMKEYANGSRFKSFKPDIYTWRAP